MHTEGNEQGISTMRHEEGVFKGFGGIELYWQCWRPQEVGRGVIVFVPGLGDHSGRHAKLVNCLVDSDYEVYAFDLRGNGRSPGQRGHINSWQELREDVRAFKKYVELRSPNLPLFLLGFSLGGLAALEYALHYPQGLRGVIAISAPVGNVGVPSLMMKLAPAISRIFPRFSMDMRIDRKWISRDPQVEKAHRGDPLNHGKASTRFGAEFLKAIARTQAGAADLSVPLLMQHGSRNMIAKPEGGREFFEKVTIADKQYSLYKGAYHELDDDLDMDRVFTDLTNWLRKH